MITASMSTIAWREPGLARAVASILPQVDRLNVFLQGYAEVPACLRGPKVVIATDTDHPSVAALGASAKYHWLMRGEVADGYHIVVDDDIAYPQDYARYCLAKIEEYGRKAIVGFHGAIYKPLVRRYFKDRELWSFDRGCDSDRFVHMLGTGTTAHHTSTICLELADFGHANSCDLYLGIAAQRQRVPMVCLSRARDYLKALPLASDPRSVSGPAEYEHRMAGLWRTWQPWEINRCDRADVPSCVVVVVPCYNESPDRLLRTVRSALNTPGVDSVCVVDDGSDVPVSLALDRVEVVRRHTNGGPSAALNTGIRSLPVNSTICRLDVGDIFYPEQKARQIALVKSGAAAVCSWWMDPVAGSVRQIAADWSERIFTDCQFASTATVFTKQAWLECGGFDDSLRWCDDWRFSAAMQAHVGWTVLPEATGEHGMYPGGHSDVSVDRDKRELRKLDRARVASFCAALGSPDKYAHLFNDEWCRRRGLTPLKRPRKP